MTQHIRDVHFKGESHNNKMERFNGQLRDREKVMRSLKTVDAPIIKGMQIHHNSVRPHTALDGRTPAEIAGIQIEGEIKRLTIIQNARQMTRVNSQTNAGEMTKTYQDRNVPSKGRLFGVAPCAKTFSS